MLETLLKILAKHNMHAPEILLEEDGDICLDWGDFNISITHSGGVAWAITGGLHGTNLDEFLRLLQQEENKNGRD